MRESESAYVLARARATGTIPASLVYVDGVERAEAAGRRLVLLRGAPPSAAFALGWADLAEPDPDTAGFDVQRLTPSALATLVACVACCWPDAAVDPYPSAVATVVGVLDVATRLGVDRKWATAALLHGLPSVGCVTITAALPHDEVRLGPLFATWPSGQLSLLRRAHDRLREIGSAA
jgi:hypothetical protein